MWIISPHALLLERLRLFHRGRSALPLTPAGAVEFMKADRRLIFQRPCPERINGERMIMRRILRHIRHKSP